MVPKFESLTLFEIRVGSRFKLLNRLWASTRNSTLAPSPRTGALGRPKAFAKVKSTPLYQGRLNELRWTPGDGGSVVPKKAGYGGVGEKYAGPPLGKFEFATVLNASLLVLPPAPPKKAAGNSDP